MRAKLTEAMRARDATRTQFLRYWIAALTKSDGTEMSETEAVNKMRGVLKEAKGGTTTFTAEEIALLQEWVPPSLTQEQVVELLAPSREAIHAAAKDGIAMGIAMKALAGQQVDSQDVKAAVASIRGSG
ncbi:GatB/YqeY domain-containing protein [Singulisphaera rosea]